MTTTQSAAVDITTVKTGTVKIPVTDLAVGDTVFDCFGGEYQLTKVRKFKQWVRTTRNDGWADIWLNEDTITVRRVQ